MSDLSELVAACKCGVYVEVNTHRDVYESVDDYLGNKDTAGTPEDVLDGMRSSDSAVRIQFYPDTPIGFYTVHHHSVDAAVSAALRILADERKGKVVA